MRNPFKKKAPELTGVNNEHLFDYRCSKKEVIIITAYHYYHTHF